MFNRIRSKLSSLLIGAALTMGATFNRNVTVPTITTGEATVLRLPVKKTKAQRRKNRGGIKGIKGTAVSAVHYRLRAGAN